MYSKFVHTLFVLAKYLCHIKKIRREDVCNRDFKDCCMRMRLSVITLFCSKAKILRKKGDDTRIYGKRTHLIHFKEKMGIRLVTRLMYG
ncbi:hypothetical protein VNO80_28287 [Phaseolus coccineus]|uniref:Uncharacterized protein n=1 Tax=Phaseolus coccineus TaxID=3886 RepID=A0AAN9QDU2_PHACN